MPYLNEKADHVHEHVVVVGCLRLFETQVSELFSAGGPVLKFGDRHQIALLNEAQKSGVFPRNLEPVTEFRHVD